MSCINGVICEGEGDVNICLDCFDAFTSQLDRIVKAYRRDYKSPELEDLVAAAEELVRQATAAEARVDEEVAKTLKTLRVLDQAREKAAR